MVEYLLSFSWTSREECERLVAASWFAGVELILIALPCFACPVSLLRCAFSLATAMVSADVILAISQLACIQTDWFGYRYGHGSKN